MIRPDTQRRDDSGLGLVGLVVSLAVLGLLAAGTAIGVSGLPGRSTPTLPGLTTGATAPAPGILFEASIAAACRADAESADMAQQAFRALSASSAFAGTSPTAGGVSLLVQAHDLRSPPGNATRYTIDMGTSGAVNVTNLKTTATASFEADPAICDGA